MPSLLPIQAASTCALVGLIWLVQLVQYPLFARIGDGSFVAYHGEHCRRITWIVAPLMATELVTAGLLLAAPRTALLPAWAPWIGAALVAVVWLSTALIQVPLHNRLGQGFDPELHRRLVDTNWIRTIAWSVRGLLCLWMWSRVT